MNKENAHPFLRPMEDSRLRAAQREVELTTKQLENYINSSIPRYIAGIDPASNSKNSVAAIFGELQTIKEKKKMKTKKFYHTFELGKRTVTLCLLVTAQEKGLEQFLFNKPETADLSVGYAVCHPDDEFNEDLAKKISLGRAEKEKSQLEDLGYVMPQELAFDLGILKGFALRAERLISQGHIVIKGIKDVE